MLVQALAKALCRGNHDYRLATTANPESFAADGRDRHRSHDAVTDRSATMEAKWRNSHEH